MKKRFRKINELLVVIVVSLVFPNLLFGQSVDIIPEFTSGTCSDLTVDFDGVVTNSTTATQFDFNTGTLPPGWSSSPYTVGQPCDAPNGNSPDNSDYYWATTLDGTVRYVITSAENVSYGGDIKFYLRFGNDDPEPGCEKADLGEGVYLQYSTDGGSTWTGIAYIDPASYHVWTHFTYAIPAGAQTASTKFKWYQTGASGDNYDNWGLDDVSIESTVGVSSYLWKIDGVNKGTSEDLTYTFPSPATYSVFFEVVWLDASTANKTINYQVLPNQEPTINGISTQNIQEDDPQQTVNMSGISDGDGCVVQTVSIAATSSNTSLIPNPTVNFTSGNSTGQLYYTPQLNQNGSTLITVTVTDDGGTASGGDNQKITTFTINVAAVNDAPVLTPIAPNLTVITEDETNNVGDLISGFLGSSVSDVDAGDPEGIAVFATTGNSYWQYKVGVGSWTNVGAVATGTALLLRATDYIRYVPDAENGETATFSYYAWDQSSGSAGTKVNAGTRGGATAFSTASDVASITVTDVNDAPVLADLAYVLTDTYGVFTIDISTLISTMIGAGITDVDNGAVEGIAVTAIDNTNGIWEYSLNGSTWVGMDPVSSASSLLLDIADYIRFRANYGYEGTSSLNFRAWDRSDALAPGSKTSTTANGTIYPFSSLNDAATITVNRVYANSMNFNGSTQYVDLGNSSSFNLLGDLTIQAWVNWTSGTGTVISRSNSSTGEANNTNFSLAVNTDGSVDFSWEYGANLSSGIQTAAGVITSGQWHHIAVIRDVEAGGSRAAICIDGFEETSTTGESSPTGGTATINTQVGRNGTATPNYFNGKIDELKVWDAILTRAETNLSMFEEIRFVSSVIGCGSGLTLSALNWGELVAYYSFDFLSSDIIFDHTGNNNGTRYSTTLSNIVPFANWRHDASSSSWTTISNWKGFRVPTITTVLYVVLNNATNPLVVTANTTVDYLVVFDNSNYSINQAVDLIINKEILLQYLDVSIINSGNVIKTKANIH